VLQVSAQLDAARRELDSASLRATELGTKLADLEEELPRASDAAQRSALQDGIRGMKRELTAASAQEQQARSRETELSQSLQTEESRWSALISRLEALTQR
jgi:chromosome segregation ATPase